MSSFPVTNNPALSPLQRWLLPQQGVSGWQRTGEFLQTTYTQGKSLVGGVTYTFVGLVSILGGMIASTFAPDRTGIDWLSKIGVILGTVIAGTGIYKLIKFNNAKAKEVISPRKIADSNIVKSCDDALGILKNIVSQADPAKAQADISKLGLIDTTSPSIDKAALRENLFRIFEGYINEVQASSAVTPKPSFKFGDREIKPHDMPDHIINLLGNLMFSRTDVAIDSASDKIQNKTLKEIIAPLLGNDGVTNLGKEFLPPHFNLVYDAARFYVNNHLGIDTAVKRIFVDQVNNLFGIDTQDLNNLNDLIARLKTNDQSDKEKAGSYFNDVVVHYDNLKILHRAITYVLENQNTNDIAKAENINRIKHALILGLRLQGKSEDDFRKELEKVLFDFGATKGLASKVKEAEGYYEKLNKTILTSGEVPWNARYSEFGDEIFPSGQFLISDIQYRYA